MAESSQHKDVDGPGHFLIRLLNSSPSCSEQSFIESHWNLTETRLKSYSDSAQNIHREIEALEKAQGVAPHAHESLKMEIKLREARRHKWHIRLLQGVVYNKLERIKSLEKNVQEQILYVEKKNVEIEALQREGEILRNSLCEATKRLDEKSELIKSFETRMILLMKNLKEKDLEMERKLGEKELLMELNQKKGEADRVQSEEAHKRECDSLRAEVQHRKAMEGCYLARYLEKSLEALEDAGIISQTPPRTNLSDGWQNAYRNCSDKPEVNIDAGHEGDVIQTKMDVQTEQPETKKRSRDEVVQAVARNVSGQPFGNTEMTKWKGKKTRNKIHRYGEEV